MLSYELLTGISTGVLRTRVQEILISGWRCGNYPTVFLDSNIPWAQLDNAQRSWNFHIHSWDMLDAPLAAYSAEQQPELLILCVNIALDWSARYGSGPKSDTPFAWYDMAVGLRAYRLAYLLDAARAAQVLSAQEDALLWEALLAHQAYLVEDANIAFHSNHGYYQVAGQLAMGRRFSAQSPLMAQAHAQGKARLRLMLEQQFAADGVHREHSPDYHRMVYDTLSGLIGSGLVADPDLIELSEQVEQALAWFVLPNRRLVNFGDSDYRDISRSTKQAESEWRAPAMRWQASAGMVGKSPGSGLKRFEQGGYFVYRQPVAGFTEQAAYLAQTAAFHSRTHKHADDLSFFWYDRGSEVLVDAGRYGYLGKTEQDSDLWLDGHWYSDPKRVYCESTRAHNCLEFDASNYPRRGIKPYGVALGRSLELPCGLVAMETECRHFKGNRHARLLLLMPGEWLIVFDWFHDNLASAHDVRQWFHLAEDWQLESQGNGYKAVSGKTGQGLQVAPLISGSAASRTYYGESEPQLQGWWSPSERQLLPNFAFCYEQTGTVSGSFATLFSFIDGIETDFVHSKANVSGRQIRLKWQDNLASHRLEIARPAEGELLVDYSRHNRS
ncbi:heparinase II/III-family protein [Ectopseudomonas hydrolytica]|uniref:Heparinase II/III-family protein n=1 Tax=Ectopseudomonas hydrolytica TaxID=2493633 RepID=A0ABY5ACX6_9GAMM|nr:heparinase II/III family protein [Pseudomonas hydrolytica]USR41531.1 heparinase II/III-family protein [Pseudomonas hydrolytica]